jgi:signal transduction histidine kinase
VTCSRRPKTILNTLFEERTFSLKKSILQNFQLTPVRTVQIAKFMLIAAAINFIFWGVFKPLVISPPTNLSLISLGTAKVAQLSTPTVEAAAAAKYENIKVPYSNCCAPQYFSIRFKFDLETVPATGLGLIKDMDVDNFILSVNGTIISSQGRMKAGQQTFHGQPSKLEHIPAGILKSGGNIIEFVTVRASTPYTDIRNPILGEYESLRTASARRLWVLNDYRMVVAIITALVGLVCILLMFRTDNRLFLFWFAVLSLIWSAKATYTLILDWPLEGQTRFLYYLVVNLLAPLALYNLIDSWTQRPMLKVQYYLFGLVAVTFAYLAYRFFNTDMPAGFLIADTMLSWALLTFGLASILRFAVHIVKYKETRILEIAVLSLIGIAIILDAYAELIDGSVGGNVLSVTPAFLLALLIAFLNQNFYLFRSAQQINIYLKEKIKMRETLLVHAHEREKELVRNQAFFEERQRIMRDMHDGLGSRLMAMLLAAKRGKANAPDVAEGLQSVIDEMRLMIDSMDSVGESVAVALKTFEDRTRIRVKEAGLNFKWVSDATRDFPDYAPREVLQVFRILQEATMNALKHSNGSEISVRIIDSKGASSGVSILVVDNGAGFTGKAGVGRGLGNMTSRADQISAKLDILKKSNGVEVRLALPAKNSQPELAVKT